MEYLHPVRDRAISQYPRETMSTVHLAIVLETTIAADSFLGAKPFPAIAALVNTFPEYIHTSMESIYGPIL